MTGHPRSQPNGDLLRQALIAAKCTAGNDGTYVHASMDDVLAALAPAVATGEPNLLLLQARYVLKNLNAEQPGCGYDKLATACEEAALLPAKAAGDVRAAVIEALFEPREANAIDNLEGAIFDINRLSFAGKPTDAVCIRTLERIQKQLIKARRALAQAPATDPAGGQS